MINLPVEFENRMKEMLGGEFEEFKASYDDKKKTGIRVNTIKISKDEFLKSFPAELSPVPWCDKGFVATEEMLCMMRVHFTCRSLRQWDPLPQSPI